MNRRRLDDDDAAARALFVVVGSDGPAHHRVSATDHGRGPWDHGLLHGGPVGGLAAWAAEQVADDDRLLCGRLTLELLGAVPRAELDVTASVVKPGARSSVVDVAIHHDGPLVARASTQWLAPSVGFDTGEDPPPPRPDTTADPAAGVDIEYPRPGFNCDAAELRFASGSTESSGPAVVWARLTSPLMAGRPTTDLVRVATLADLAAAAGWEHDLSCDEVYINPDLTLQLHRYPRGPWVGIDARNRRTAGAVGFNDAVLFDGCSAVGRVTQSLVASPMRL
ncbi:MAG: thioesterase family protein [Acidimicrobiales bacterium]